MLRPFSVRLLQTKLYGLIDLVSTAMSLKNPYKVAGKLK